MTEDIKQREGVLVKPELRLSKDQIATVDATSRELLSDMGMVCFNEHAVEIFRNAGAEICDGKDAPVVKIPSRLIDNALKTAPSKFVLGARNPDNRLILDAAEPRVRFGSGSETNFILDVDLEGEAPKFSRRAGQIEDLKNAAHLAENLENLDFFIRCVNIQDKDITASNKDINKFLAALDNTTKHVQGGLTDINALDDIIRLGVTIAGGEKEFEENPVLSFITCIVKSPFQIVDDTTDTLIEIAKRKVPVVLSTCPMAGATGPFGEFGMVAQINAEILAAITLMQIVSPGSPALYGGVAVRTRLDTLNDMYGAPEFSHYSIGCAQMARYYGIPCYSSANVADTDVPGIQATVEKMTQILTVPRGGPQYIHYCFGLLERTNIFCPEQAVIDDTHISFVKRMLKESPIDNAGKDDVIKMVKEVMDSTRTYMYHLPIPSRDDVYVRYPLEDSNGVLYAAQKEYRAIMEKDRVHLPEDIRNEIASNFSGILPATLG